MQQKTLRGLYCGGKETCRQSSPPRAEIFLRQPIVECEKIGYTIVTEVITV